MDTDHLPPDSARNTGTGAPSHRQAGRERGAQKGNRNARKHGFYCGALDPEEICEFWNIVTFERLAPEVALLRIKLRSSLQRDPGNPRVLRDASRLLATWYSSRFGLDRTDSRLLKSVIRAILVQCAGASPGRPGDQDG